MTNSTQHAPRTLGEVLPQGWLFLERTADGRALLSMELTGPLAKRCHALAAAVDDLESMGVDVADMDAMRRAAALSMLEWVFGSEVRETKTLEDVLSTDWCLAIVADKENGVELLQLDATSHVGERCIQLAFGIEALDMEADEKQKMRLTAVPTMMMWFLG